MVVMAAPVRDASVGMRLRPGREASAPWIVADLAALPDDGLRYELIDGALIVSPSPNREHQRESRKLLIALDAACPPGLEVFHAPLGWQPTLDRSFEPDLLVVPRSSGNLPVTDPVLLVEILSPSTQAVDRGIKFHAYAAAGVPQYWIVDPGLDGAPPSIEVYDLEPAGSASAGTGGEARYRLQGRAVGGETLSVRGPVPIDVIPGSLTR